MKPMEEPRACPVCGLPAKDGLDDQVVLWGWGVHDASTNSLMVMDDQIDEMVILHKVCLLMYVEGKFAECRVESRSN